MAKDIYDTFPKLLLRNYQTWPDLIAMRKKDFGVWWEYTWKQCYENVKYFSLGLISMGLQRGDRVAIIGENEPQWFWAEFAAQFRETQDAFLKHETAKTELKALLPHDAREAVGHGVRAKRSKSGAVSFELLQQEPGHAAV